MSPGDNQSASEKRKLSGMTANLLRFYNEKVIFLTGSTGCVGLATTLKLLQHTNVKRIYALVRATPGQEQQRLEGCWVQHFPSEASTMSASKRVVAVLGDVALPGFGLDPAIREEIRSNVNIIIHAAADISLVKTVQKLAKTNIQSVLALAEFARSFAKLERFIYVSSLFSQIDQRLAGEDNPYADSTEAEYKAVLEGQTLFPVQDVFVFNYAYTKNLAERLLLNRYKDLPVLILRPSVIGPAYAEPKPMWTLIDSMPLTNFFRLMMRVPQNTPCIHRCDPDYPSGKNLFDEVPVDYVINVMLAHIAAGTRGPVNANSGSLKPRVANELVRYMQDAIPPQKFDNIPFSQMQGIPRIFKIFGIQHPVGCSKKTVQLFHRMLEEDRKAFNVDICSWDLDAYQVQRAAMLRALDASTPQFSAKI